MLTPLHYAPPTEPWLDVLHVDRDLIVLDKPSGLLSVPGRGPDLQDSAYSRVLAEYPLAQVVHRLDLATSGVLVFALRRKAERELRRQFREREVRKTYLASVWGVPEPGEGEVDLPLGVGQAPLQRVDHEAGKPARTLYRVLAQDGATSLLELVPVTGRSHQLRVHMAALGHPILGDLFYAHAAAQALAGRLLLHAWRLELKHPYSGEALAFECHAPWMGSGHDK